MESNGRVSVPVDSATEDREGGFFSGALARTGAWFLLRLLVLVVVAGALRMPKPPPGSVLGRLETVWQFLLENALALTCLVPWLLMYAMLALTTGSLDGRNSATDARRAIRLPPAPSPDDRDGRAAAEAAEMVAHEHDRMGVRSMRVKQQVNFYGVLSTLVLAVTTRALVEAHDWWSSHPMDHFLMSPHPRYAYTSIMIAVTAAVAARFIGDASEIIVRAARRDTSERMFAWATRRLLIVIMATVLTCACIFLGGIEARLPAESRHPVIAWMLVGGGVSLLGTRAIVWVSGRVAGVLGMPRSQRELGEAFADVSGLSDAAAARLSEEGVEDVHALAFASTPKLFFSTPFTLQEICDWQDQCLLIVRLGAAKAKLCREQLLIQGATDLQRLAREILAKKEPEEDFIKILGLVGGIQARVTIEHLAEDPVAARLAVYRAAVPVADTPAEAPPARPLAPSSAVP